MFRCRIEEIDNELKKSDRVPDVKRNREGGGDGSHATLSCKEDYSVGKQQGENRDVVKLSTKASEVSMESLGEKQGECEAEKSVSAQKIGKWSRLQIARLASKAPLEVEVGHTRFMLVSTEELEGSLEGMKKKGRVEGGCEEGTRRMAKAGSQPRLLQ